MRRRRCPRRQGAADAQHAQAHACTMHCRITSAALASSLAPRKQSMTHTRAAEASSSACQLAMPCRKRRPALPRGTLLRAQPRTHCHQQAAPQTRDLRMPRHPRRPPTRHVLVLQTSNELRHAFRRFTRLRLSDLLSESQPLWIAHALLVRAAAHHDFSRGAL